METTQLSKGKVWTARILSGFATLFMIFDMILHIFNTNAATSSLAMLGYDPHVSVALGVTLLVCLVLFMIPRTAFLGALLLTGYLGGAAATNVRVGAPIWAILFPVVIAIFLWSGLYVTSASLRSLIGKDIRKS